MSQTHIRAAIAALEAVAGAEPPPSPEVLAVLSVAVDTLRALVTATTADQRLAAVYAAHPEITEERKKTLAIAAELGADDALLKTIAEAPRVRRGPDIVLPKDRLEGLSRGRGWCRREGRGESTEWGDRENAGYRVGPGRWVVGGADGFNRKKSTNWDVKHISVGGDVWTVAY